MRVGESLKRDVVLLAVLSLALVAGMAFLGSARPSNTAEQGLVMGSVLVLFMFPLVLQTILARHGKLKGRTWFPDHQGDERNKRFVWTLIVIALVAYGASVLLTPWIFGG